MSTSQQRLRPLAPPHRPLAPVHRWLLEAAFAPVPPASLPGDPHELLALARRHGLLGRIAGRWVRSSPPGERDRELAAISRRTAAEELVRGAAAEAVAAAATRRGVPVVLLKHAALAEIGALVPGTRGAGDVDVLAPAEGIPSLLAELAAVGFRPSGAPDQDHHLPPLLHPELGPLELHRHLPGLRAPGSRRPADHGALAAAGLLEPAPRLGAPVFVPTRPALATHLLAHALVQHRHRPDGYSTLRLVADLVDLRAEDGGATRELAGAWTRLPEAEVAGAAELAACLAGGRLPAAGCPAGTLLAHAIWSLEDAGYAAALKLRDLAEPVTEHAPWRAWLANSRRALVLTDGQIDAIYGRPRSGWGYLGRRVARPLDLALRVGRAWAGRRRAAS